MSFTNNNHKAENVFVNVIGIECGVSYPPKNVIFIKLTTCKKIDFVKLRNNLGNNSSKCHFNHRTRKYDNGVSFPEKHHKNSGFIWGRTS